MTSPIIKLLRHAGNDSPCVFDYWAMHEILTQAEIDLLLQKKVLSSGKNLTELPCESCEHGELVEVKYDKHGAYYVCHYEGGKQRIINSDKLKTWELNFHNIAGLISDALVVLKQSEVISSDETHKFYYVGEYILYGKTFSITFCRVHFDDIVLQQLFSLNILQGNIIVLANGTSITKKISPIKLLAVSIHNLLDQDTRFKSDVFKNIILASHYFEGSVKTVKRLIEKDTQGDYYYNEQLINMPHTAGYYKLFDALFNECDQSGFLSYENIENALVARGEKPAKDEKSRNKRINNLLSPDQGLFRYAKVRGNVLQNITLNGKKLIDVVRGKGLKFDNPPMGV